MSIVDDLADLFLDVCVATPGVLDEFGKFIPSGASLNLPCRIEGETRLVRDPSGQEVTSSVQVIVAGYNDLNVEGYRYTLPSRYTPRADLRAIAVDKVSSDEKADEYEELAFP